MIREENGRAVLHCDGPRCAVRLDVGRAVAWRAGAARLPSCWHDFGNGRHQCPMHAAPAFEPPAAMLGRHAA